MSTRGLDRRALRLGQRFRVGTTGIELVQVRVPCTTVGVYGQGIQAAMYDAHVQAGDATSLRWGLSGFYASVRQPGVINPGDTITLVQSVHSRVTLS